MLGKGCQFSLKLLLGNCCGCPHDIVGNNMCFCYVSCVMHGVGKGFRFNYKIMINI